MIPWRKNACVQELLYLLYQNDYEKSIYFIADRKITSLRKETSYGNAPIF